MTTDSKLSDRYQSFVGSFYDLELATAGYQGGAEVLPRICEVIHDGRKLLGAGLPPEQDRELQSKIAEALEKLAVYHLSLGRFLDAHTTFEEAIEQYLELQNPTAVERCREHLQFLARTASGDLDSDFEELLKKLEEVKADSFEHVSLRVRTAGLYQGVGDTEEARSRLQEAVAELARLQIVPPSAVEIREALERDLERYASTSLEAGPGTARPGLELAAILSLYVEIYTAFAFLSRQEDSVEAARYAALAQELLTREVDEETAHRLLGEARERRKRQSEAEWEGLTALLKPAGGAPWMQEDLSLPDDDLRRQMRLLEQQSEENQRHLEEQLEKQRRAAGERIDQAIEESLGRQLVDPARLRIELALLAVQNGNPRTAAARQKLLPRAERLESQARQLQNPALLANAAWRHSEILLGLGREEEALQLLGEAEELLLRFEPHEQAVPILCTLAELYARRGDWRTVSAVCERGITLVERYRFRVTPPYLQTFYLRSRLTLYTLGVRAAYELGEVDRMLERADPSKSRAVLGYARMAESPAPDLGESEKELRQIGAEIDKALATGASPSLLIAKRRPIWERFFIARAAGRGLPGGERISLPAVQARLAPDEAVLYYYWLDPETLLIAAIDDSRVHHELRTLSTAERRDLESFSPTVSPGANLSGSTTPAPGRRYPYADPKELRGIDRNLLPAGPVAEGLAASLARLSPLLLPAAGWLREKRRLLLSPHRLLHTIPFQALSWEGEILLRRFAISYVPNLGSLLLEHAKPAANQVLAVGICHSRVLASPLPLAEQEVRDLGETYRTQGIEAVVLAGEEARKERLLELAATAGLGGFGCLHFATHGSDVAEDAPMESQLVLYDAILDGIEISSWQLQADLVVLSACWSAKRPARIRGMAEIPGDEVLGLEGAFFAAGARRILGALWPVNDRTAYEVMIRFHREWSAGLLPEIALQKALLAYLDENPSLEDPFDWAPFLLVCLGRPSPGTRALAGSS